MPHIYALLDPRDGLPHYIGQAVSISKRYREHISACKDSKQTPKQEWLEDLRNNGAAPTIEVLEKVSKTHVNDREVYWIQFGRRKEWPLTNVAGGGQGNPFGVIVDEFRRAFREAVIQEFGSLPLCLREMAAMLEKKCHRSPANKSATALLLRVKSRLQLEDRIAKLEQQVESMH